MGFSGAEFIIKMVRLITSTSLQRKTNFLHYGCLTVDKLQINTNQKAFFITIDELFDVVTKIVAHPHTAIVSHDKHRAAKIFLALQDYISNHVQGQEGFGHFVYSEPALDFDTFVEDNFNEKELEQIRSMG